ncbi:MAG TPA: polyphosphate kinase 2 family protein [Clostridia bacterium]
MNLSDYTYNGEKDFKLSKFNVDDTGNFKSKEDGLEKLDKNIHKMIELQDKLYAQNEYALLLVFQAMDTAGKDGAIKNVTSGLNPQGTQVYSFKQPSKEELDHDYLWKYTKCLPERGRIGIFNRSYYEEVLVVKVHNLIDKQQIPRKMITKDIWKNRYEHIRCYEKYLYDNGIIPIKFFLHISKDEQKKRLLERIEDKTKNWKFSDSDIAERKYWNEYQDCFEDAIGETGTKYAPWYIVPSNHKWFSRVIISEAIVQTLERLDLKYPEVSKEQLDTLLKCKKILLEE